MRRAGKRLAAALGLGWLSISSLGCCCSWVCPPPRTYYTAPSVCYQPTPCYQPSSPCQTASNDRLTPTPMPANGTFRQ